MKVVTLTTDFGNKDFSAAVTRAALLSSIPDVTVVDISHKISPFNLMEAAYVVKNAYKAFPKGSIHLIGVESEFTPDNSHLAMLLEGHYFIGANNGILSLIAENIHPEKIVAINIHENVVSTFPVLDVFVKVAAHIAQNRTLEVVGKPIRTMKELRKAQPVVKDTHQILGIVIYIDNYGNVITNITKQLFKEVGKSKAFTISTRGLALTKISHSYSGGSNMEKTIREGDALALFNSVGHLELAIYKSNPETTGSASSLFGLYYGDSITVKFE